MNNYHQFYPTTNSLFLSNSNYNNSNNFNRYNTTAHILNKNIAINNPKVLPDSHCLNLISDTNNSLNNFLTNLHNENNNLNSYNKIYTSQPLSKSREKNNYDIYNRTYTPSIKDNYNNIRQIKNNSNNHLNYLNSDFKQNLYYSPIYTVNSSNSRNLNNKYYNNNENNSLIIKIRNTILKMNKINIE